MGSRKKIAAENRKENRKSLYSASLKNCPTSPRKMRLIADIIRGKDVEESLSILKHKPNDAAGRLYKLVLSAIANWQEKNKGVRIEDQNLYVKSIMVDSARVLKRIRPAPQGRAHRIRKRSNHVSIVLGTRQELLIENQQ
jgi:large subunit ribosomal protein L22